MTDVADNGEEMGSNSSPARGETKGEKSGTTGARLVGCTVRADGLRKAFGSRTLWGGLDFTIEPGAMIALVGPSGCGKSTLLNCMGLLEKPTSGALTIDGTDVTRMNGHTQRVFRRDKLGYLFQDYALIDNETVQDNLNIALLHVPHGQRKALASEALGVVGLAGREDDVVYRMSGGEQQRVALARLLLKRPGLVLADEPTGALDKANAAMVVRTLRRMAGMGATVVIATHSDAVAAACDIALNLADYAGRE